MTERTGSNFPEPDFQLPPEFVVRGNRNNKLTRRHWCRTLRLPERRMVSGSEQQISVFRSDRDGLNFRVPSPDGIKGLPDLFLVHPRSQRHEADGSGFAERGTAFLRRRADVRDQPQQPGHQQGADGQTDEPEHNSQS